MKNGGSTACSRARRDSGSDMLIHLYGEYWNPDAVEWGSKGKKKGGSGNKGQLSGKVKIKSGKKTKTVIIDFWNARGVYALYDNFRLVYVGVAYSGKAGCLGKRLRDHLTDRFAGRWDMFSWFSTSTLRTKTVRPPGTRQVKPGPVISTLEAFAITLASPPLNRRYNEMPGARLIEQAKAAHPATVRHYLETLVKRADSLGSKLEKVEKKIPKKGK